MLDHLDQHDAVCSLQLLGLLGRDRLKAHVGPQIVGEPVDRIDPGKPDGSQRSLIRAAGRRRPQPMSSHRGPARAVPPRRAASRISSMEAPAESIWSRIAAHGGPS